MGARADGVVRAHLVLVLVVGLDVGVVIGGAGDGAGGYANPAAAKDITAFNVVPREGSKGFKECYAWNQPFLMECNRTDTPS